MDKTKNLIERISLSAQTGFDLDVETCDKLAKKYVFQHPDLVNDPAVQHGNVDMAAFDMLDEYNVFTKAELKQYLLRFAGY